MAHQAHIHHVSPSPLPHIHHVCTDNPWNWLAAGWGDFIQAPGIGLAYGFVVSVAMMLVFYILQTTNFFAFALALLAGFVFIGPLLAVGLYEISRRLEQRMDVSLADSWRGWRRNTRSLLGLGVVMMIMLLSWFLLSAQVAAIGYGIAGDVGLLTGTTPDWQTFVLSIRWPMALSFGLIGLVAVAVTFVLTVVSVPMLTDKEDMDIITAIFASIRTVRKNPSAMVLWAGLIALFTGVAVVPVFLGLIVVFPLLAYSTWHAYRDLIEH